MNKKQAITFFAIILGGLGISLYTLNIFGEKVEETEEKTPVEVSPVEPEPVAPKPVVAAPPKPAEPVVPEPMKDGAQTFSTPDALVGALVDKIRARDVEGFLAVAGEEAISPIIRPQVEGLLRDEKWSPNPETPISQLAKSADSVRWSIHFQQAGAAPAVAGSDPVGPLTTEIYADLAASEDKTEWSVKKIALPLDFAEVTGLAPGPGSMKLGEGAAPGSPGVTTGSDGTLASGGTMSADASDALTVAYAFSQALIERNFDLARKLTDSERVTDERVAALMIALEEGSFHLREDKPLIVTLSRDELTWVLTRVDSEGTGSEFAVEMGKASAQADWKIHGLTFSKLIAALASQAGAGGVAYAPIVADPQGGDSLVLYFEFDEDRVNARSSRQLRIIADILRSDPTRKIHINGHADALGSDDYNEGLSNGRAASIREALVEFGVSGDQIVTKAFGEAMPRRPNFNADGTDNPDNRSQNRRAEVYLDF